MKVRDSVNYVGDLREWAQRPDNRIRLGLFDDDFRGIAPGELMLLEGGSWVGKTNIMLNIVCNRLDLPQLVVSLEMPARQLVARMVSIHYDIPYRRIEDGIRENDASILSCLDDAVDEFSDVRIIDTPGVDVDTLDEWFASEGDSIRLVSIDYLELLDGPARNDPLQHVISTATSLKNLVKRHDVAGICLHQPKREGGWKPLTMQSGRYGGETQSDYVFGCFRPSLDPEMEGYEAAARRTEVIVQTLKNRDGTHIDDKVFDMDLLTVRLEARGVVEDAPAGTASPERTRGAAAPADAAPPQPEQLDMHYDAVAARNWMASHA